VGDAGGGNPDYLAGGGQGVVSHRPYRVVVLGGYGNFGARICQALAQENGLAVIVAGRNGARAAETAHRLTQSGCPARLEASALDAGQADLAQALRALDADLVTHTCGPFQGQDYQVARACIDAQAHYVDLADARRFVTGFAALDAEARAAGVLAVSGASSVPALSAAVVDQLLPEFSALHGIDLGINPGNQTPRGLATVQSILSYCGQPLRQWHDGQWRTVYGWQGLKRRRYPAPMGRRWLGYCDVPDLELFPQRYPAVREVVFRAGLEIRLLHLGTWVLSWLVRAGLVNNWRHHAPQLKRISEWFEGWGSTRGGMHVELQGLDHDGRPLRRCWTLLADSGDGPQIPCTAAVVMAKKLARGEIDTAGAMPCLGFFTIEEFMQALAGFDVVAQLQEPQ